jgi:hypothetical protein
MFPFITLRFRFRLLCVRRKVLQYSFSRKLGRQTWSERSGEDENLHPFRESNKNRLVVQNKIVTKDDLGNMIFNSFSTDFLKKILL